MMILLYFAKEVQYEYCTCIQYYITLSNVPRTHNLSIFVYTIQMQLVYCSSFHDIQRY